MLWTDGVARVMPAWELFLGNYTIPAAFWVALLSGAILAGVLGYFTVKALAATGALDRFAAGREA